MIEVKGLCHSLGGNPVLQDVCLHVAEGSITGLVGVNGAGKSTLLRLLSGVYLPDEGSITLGGGSPCREETRREIFFLPDDPYYTTSTTLSGMLALYTPFYTMDTALYRRLIEEFHLDEKKPLRAFSKGMRRQAYIAVALAVRPRYLLLDEAFDGLDPLARKTVKNELIRLVEEEGSTVVISSHSLRELEDFCDSFILLDGKTVAAAGDISSQTGRYCRFMLAFCDGLPEGLFAGLPLVSEERSDRFVRAVFEGEAAEIEAALSAYSPAVLEELPVDFEEVFISTVEGRRKL